MGQTDWIPGLVALGIGLAAGLGFALRGVRRASGMPGARERRPPRGEREARPGEFESRREELEAQRDEIIARLRELDTEPASTPGVARERYELELQAARVLQDLDRLVASRSVRSDDEEQGSRRAPKSGIKSVLLGAWAGATLVLLAVFVRDMMAERGPVPMVAGMIEPGAGESMQGHPPDVTGVIVLGPGTDVPAGATVFVIARPAGAPSMPPVAARRLSADRFPLVFALGPEHSMTGERFPDTALIQARLDFDGDAATRDPAEPVAVVDGVARGTEGLRLELRAPGLSSPARP